MKIETQLAADNNIMHFFTESGFPVTGSVEFADAKSLRRSPLAENIFDLGDIASIVITPDCLSVTKGENADWDSLKPQILAEIMDCLTKGEAPVTAPKEDKNEKLALLEIRTHALAYLKGMPEAKQYKELICKSKTEEEFLNILDNYKSKLKELD